MVSRLQRADNPSVAAISTWRAEQCFTTQSGCRQRLGLSRRIQSTAYEALSPYCRCNICIARVSCFSRVPYWSPYYPLSCLSAFRITISLLASRILEYLALRQRMSSLPIVSPPILYMSRYTCVPVSVHRLLFLSRLSPLEAYVVGVILGGHGEHRGR